MKRADLDLLEERRPCVCTCARPTKIVRRNQCEAQWTCATCGGLARVQPLEVTDPPTGWKWLKVWP